MSSALRMIWNNELDDALKRKRRRWMRGPLRPRVQILPLPWKGYGAWTLFGQIFITGKQATCPEHVRHYVIGHELGHLYGGHVYLQFLFILSYATMVATEGTQSSIALLALCLTVIFYVAFATPRFALAREIFADSVAVDLNGAHATLISSLWMARRVNDVDSRMRQARLQRLRGYLRGESPPM